jgi:hypothetical protein
MKFSVQYTPVDPQTGGCLVDGAVALLHDPGDILVLRIVHKFLQTGELP